MLYLVFLRTGQQSRLPASTAAIAAVLRAPPPPPTAPALSLAPLAYGCRCRLGRFPAGLEHLERLLLLLVRLGAVFLFLRELGAEGVVAAAVVVELGRACRCMGCGQPLSTRGVSLLATAVSLHLAGVQVHGVRADAGEELDVMRHHHKALAPALQVVGQPQHLCTPRQLMQAVFPTNFFFSEAPALQAVGQPQHHAEINKAGGLEQAL